MRLLALRGTGILDTAPEPAFDDIAQLAAFCCATPTALVSLVDADRQWFKARVGFPDCQTDLDRSVCRFVVEEADLVVIPDLTADERTAANPLVTGEPGIRFYAGAPLTDTDGHVLGALCVIDGEPRPDGLSAGQADALRALARRTVEAIALRATAQGLRSASDLRDVADARQDALIAVGDALRDCGTVEEMTRAAAGIVGRTLDASRAGYGTVDAAVERIDIEPDWTADGVASIAGSYRFEDFGSIRDELAAGSALVIDDVTMDPRTAADPGPMLALDIGALVNVPVRERGRTVAVFIVHAREARHWTAAELAFVRNVADRLEVGIARLRADERQAVLNGEIAHRLKNSLAMVQAIANQTLRRSTDPAELDAFSARLLALGTAHDALLGRGLRAADLGQLVDRVLGLAGVDGRYDANGPPVEFGARAALSTSLLLHELATNAAKYGALRGEGRIDVSWRLDEDGRDLVLEWRESGGPVVTPPSRTGFGSRLLRLGLVGTGGATVNYDPAGVHASFRALSSHLAQG